MRARCTFGKVGVREQSLVKAKKLMPDSWRGHPVPIRVCRTSVQVIRHREAGGDARWPRSPTVLSEITSGSRRSLQLNQRVQSIAAANEPSVLPEDSMLSSSAADVLRHVGQPHPMLDLRSPVSKHPKGHA
jgi:hypothetical protein